MIELTTTRHNELIDPIVHVWGWEIPIYLFIGGWVAGMMILSGYFFMKGRGKEYHCVCYRIPLLALGLITLGMLALFLDLEHKFYVWRLYTTFAVKSPMSWGAWLLLLLYPTLFIIFLLQVPDWISARWPILHSWSQKLRSVKAITKIVGMVNIVMGIILGTYTGILLSALGARPLWNSAILCILFLVSGLSTAAAMVHMIAKERAERELLARADNLFLFMELLVLALFFIGLLSSTNVQIQSAMLLLNGPYAAVFWVFVVLLGIVVPLFIQNLAVNHKIIHTPVSPIMVIIGGLILRFIIVSAGQFSHYANAHFIR